MMTLQIIVSLSRQAASFVLIHGLDQWNLLTIVEKSM